MYNIISYQKRVSEIKSLIRWGALNLLLSFYVLITVIAFWTSWALGNKNC